jgi:hypothetical protein
MFKKYILEPLNTRSLTLHFENILEDPNFTTTIHGFFD